MLVILVAALGCLFISVSDCVLIEVVNPYHKGFIAKGSVFSIYCKVTELDSNRFTSYWERVTGDTVQTISNDNTVTPLFEDTGRYTVSLQTDLSTNNRKYELKINNAQPEDTSELRCRLQDTSSSTVLTVYVKPTMQINGYKPGQSIQFIASEYKNKGAKIECCITGASPLPTVKVILGFQDVTTSFLTTYVPRRVGPANISGTVYDVKVHTINFPIRPSFAQLRLTFQSQTLAYKPVSEYIIMDVLSAPTLNCGGLGAKRAELGATNFKVSCVIHGRPTPQIVRWTWDGKSVSPGTPPIDGISASHRVMNASSFVDLVFEKVQYDDFSRTFVLFVSNAYGNTTARIRLNQVMSGVTGGSVTVRLSTVVWVLVFFCQLYWFKS